MDELEMARAFASYMHSIQHKLKSYFHSCRQTFGVTEMMILFLLYVEGCQRPSQLKKRLGLASSTISGALNSLEEAKYITRSIDPHDKRGFVIRCTEKTNEVFDRDKEVMILYHSRILHELGEEKSVLLLELLKECKDIIERKETV